MNVPAFHYVAILFCALAHHMSQQRKSTTLGSHGTHLTAAGLADSRMVTEKHSPQLGTQNVWTLMSLATGGEKNMSNNGFLRNTAHGRIHTQMSALARTQTEITMAFCPFRKLLLPLYLTVGRLAHHCYSDTLPIYKNYQV